MKLTQHLFDIAKGLNINSAPSKTTPVNADKLGIWDSVSGILNYVTFANLKATLKAYFDTLYPNIIIPVFSAYQTAASTSLTTNTSTKILLTTEEFDTDAQFDATNSKFQPTIAGYYHIDATVRFGAASFSGEASASLYKNGVVYKAEIKTLVATTIKHYSTLSEEVYMNGTTDYLELYCVANGTTLVTVGGSTSTTRFSGYLVRRA